MNRSGADVGRRDETAGRSTYVNVPASPRCRLDTAQQRLDEIAMSAPWPDALDGFLGITAELTVAQAVSYHRRDVTREVTCEAHVGITCEMEQHFSDSRLNRHCTSAIETASPRVVRHEQDRSLVVIIVPVNDGRGDVHALATLLRVQQTPVEPFVILLQMIAAYVTQWHLRQYVSEANIAADHVAAIVELMGSVVSCHAVHDACLTIVNEIAHYLDAELAVIGVVRRGTLSTQALSDTATFDHRSERVRLLQGAMEETLIRNAFTEWPARDDDRHATLAHHRVVERQMGNWVASVPLHDMHDEPVAVLSLVFSGQSREADADRRFLVAAAPYLGRSLRTVQAAQVGPVRTLLTRLFDRRWKWRLSACMLMVIMAALAVPIPHRVSCDCRLEPWQRRFAVAPHDGVLEETFVRQGDVVAVGQVLGRMDGRETRIELSQLAAAREKAHKEYDAYLSNEEMSSAQMARLEIERLDLQIQLHHQRESNLDITSGIDGIVISGDLEDVHGAPVDIGQLLFEIAPLKRLKLETAVAEYNLPHVGAGMRVFALLDGAPGEWVEGEITSVMPRAEIRDEKNVFIAIVELENPTGLLRPGMEGHAKIMSQRRAAGWILFHHTWEHLRRTVGW